MNEHDMTDVAVIGAGAAGLMAATFAGRLAGSGRRIVALDGARRLGAKILVAGGGRCNVTHDVVDENAFAGSSRKSIRNVLRRFDVADTVRFFEELGVRLKREETGKLFPTTDDAHTILDALLRAARDAGVELLHPRRVEAIRRAEPEGFDISGEWGDLRARRVVLATGGRALPKTGSDGFGYRLARSLGHSPTPRVFPALVPLVLESGHFVRTLSGIAVPATLEVRAGSGKRLVAFTDSTLCTHFGLSGPAVLDVSRYYLDARAGDPGTRLTINWLPGESFESVDRWIPAGRDVSLGRRLHERLPERLARALIESVELDPSRRCDSLTRDERRSLVRALTEMDLPVAGDRGFTHAEATAGGVPLSEVHLKTMESRVCPGLHLCGEILDVDGRIGGYNFQWAWASGFVAGGAAARGILEPPEPA